MVGFELPLWLVVPILTVALAVVLDKRQRARFTRLPPGPRPSFWGTRIPAYSWRYFETLTHQYGPLCTVWLGRSEPLVVVGTYAAAMDLLEKQSGATADRPRSIMAGETMSGDKRILLVGYGERWRRLRKMLHQSLQPKMATSFEPIQESAARTMINDNLSRPDEFQGAARKYAASVIMTVAYGKTTPTQYSDPEVQAINKFGHRLGHALRPGAYHVDSYPILKYFPGQWKRDGAQHHKEELALFAGQLDKVREGIRTGQGVDCLARTMIGQQQAMGLSDDEAAYLGGSMFGAGSDTTASAISVAVMAACLHPQAVSRAQAELDRVVGRDRPPTFSDQDDLPYVCAYVKEVFRWRPVAPGGFRHATTEDIVYGEYVIPAGTAIVGNHWSISRDPAVYPQPEEFRPQRWFVDEDVEKAELRTDITHVGYGFGRRVCPGRNVADRSAFITFSSLLWAFNFGPKRDASGQPIPIDTLGFTDTANSHPLPFTASITPRFERVQSIMDELERV